MMKAFTLAWIAAVVFVWRHFTGHPFDFNSLMVGMFMAGAMGMAIAMDEHKKEVRRGKRR